MTSRKEQFNLKDTYQISYDDAVRLIYAYLLKPELRDLATKVSIGGTINLRGFSEKIDSYKGLMGWFCHTETPETNFLSFELGNYDPANVPTQPGGDVIYPKYTFKFNGPVKDSNIDALLRAEYPLPRNPDNTVDLGAINGKMTLGEIQKFLQNPPKDPNDYPYNSYRCSFFENQENRELEQLINQPDAVAVNYYFGFDDTDRDHIDSNRIRVIFIAVDSKGHNIITSTADPTFSVLQNSWPPPPPKPY